MITPSEAIAALELWRGGRPARMDTGFRELDDVTGGFESGQVWIVAGTPGQGRSTLASQWALCLASRHLMTTHLISVREPVHLVATRLLACAGRIPSLHLWNEQLTGHDRRAVARARVLLDAAPLAVAGPEHLSLLASDPLDGIWPDALVVDDADLAAGVFPERVASFAARGLLVILTLPRAEVVTGSGLDPRWSRVADVIIDIDRPDLLDLSSVRPGEADLHLLRNRWGPQRTAVVAFQGHYARFVDMAG